MLEEAHDHQNMLTCRRIIPWASMLIESNWCVYDIDVIWHQDSPESGYVVRQQLGEWQARCASCRWWQDACFSLAKIGESRRFAGVWSHSLWATKRSVPQLRKIMENPALRLRILRVLQDHYIYNIYIIYIIYIYIYIIYIIYII